MCRIETFSCCSLRTACLVFGILGIINIKEKLEDTADNIADKTEEWKNDAQDFSQQCLDNISVLCFGAVLGAVGAVGVILLNKIIRKIV